MNKEIIKKYQDYFLWQSKARKSSGGKVKLSKWLIEPLRYYIFSIITFFIARKTKQIKQCDILF